MVALLIVYAIVVIGAVLSLKKPVWGLLIYVGLSVLRPEAMWGWAGNLRGMSRLAGLPLLIGWGFQGFGSWKFGPAKPIVTCLFLYVFWSMLSSAQAFVDQEAAWLTLVEFSKTLLPLLLGLTMIKTEKELRQFLWVIVLSQAYVALDMNRMYLGGYNRAGQEGYGGMDNNSYGISLVTTLGAALGLMLSAKNWRSRAVAGAAMLLILHTILLTYSRGAFVGMVSVGVVAILILPKRPTYIGAIVLAVLIGFRFTGPELSERLGTTFAPREMRDASAESRFDLWNDCFTIIGEHPLFGVGLENWPLVASRFGWPEGKEAHSLWVQAAAEVGIPGAIFLILFYLITIKKLWPIARGQVPGVDRSTAMFATGIILSIVGFGVSAQFVSLRGLETPFFITMVGALLLKIRASSVPEAVPAKTEPVRPISQAAVVPVRARGPIVRPS
jgi:probable O-glycosylation ligase (exosortase A-associated)